jgi:hypothetical protein
MDTPLTVLTTEKIVALFESVAPGCDTYRPPTKQSLEVIREHFGVGLPPTLVDFARNTRAFAHWFASLSDDYQDPWHIIRVNSRAKRIRRRKKGRWQNAKPHHLLVINRGHDDDFDCLDFRTRDSSTGECSLRYWAPNVEDTHIADTFQEYVEQLVSEWRHLK